MTEALLIIGSATALLFLAVVFVEGAARPGYRPLYHTGSELSLGDRGWVQVANFLQLGVGMLAFALGVGRVLDTVAGPMFIAVFGLGAIGSGVFVPDPLRGYPPDADRNVTLHGQIHNAIGPAMFMAILVAVILLVGQLDGVWQLYTVVTAVVGLGLTVGTAVSFQRDSAYTGLVQRGLLSVYLIWVVVLGVHLI